MHHGHERSQVRAKGLLWFALAAAVVGTTAFGAHAAPPGLDGEASPLQPGLPDDSARDRLLTLTGDIQWTAISGETGRHTKVKGADNSFGLVGIEWEETGDRPCQFKLERRMLHRADGIEHDHFDICGGAATSKKKDVARPGKHEYVTGLQVCLNNKKGADARLKGLRVWGRKIDPVTGTVKNTEYGPDVAERNNCKRWSKKVSCPRGMVGMKLKFHTNPKKNDRNKGHVSGLSLACREVTLD